MIFVANISCKFGENLSDSIGLACGTPTNFMPAVNGDIRRAMGTTITPEATETGIMRRTGFFLLSGKNKKR